MALIKCPECNREISDTAKRCPHCAYKIKSNLWQKVWGTRLVVIGIILEFCVAVHKCATDSYDSDLELYAFLHDNYYPTSYYVRHTISAIAFYGGIVVLIVGIIFLIMHKINSQNNQENETIEE
jgi:hypothetical protein